MNRSVGGLVQVDGIMQPLHKQCSKCRRIRRIYEFHKQGKSFRRGVCRECRSKQDRGRAR